MNIFSEAMVRLRKRSGLSARQLSLKCGLSESYVNKVEKGMMPSVVAFAKIMIECSATPEEIRFLFKALAIGKEQ